MEGPQRLSDCSWKAEPVSILNPDPGVGATFLVFQGTVGPGGETHLFSTVCYGVLKGLHFKATFSSGLFLFLFSSQMPPSALRVVRMDEDAFRLCHSCLEKSQNNDGSHRKPLHSPGAS